jgi:hypothetical protein
MPFPIAEQWLLLLLLDKMQWSSQSGLRQGLDVGHALAHTINDTLTVILLGFSHSSTHHHLMKCSATSWKNK